MVVQFPLNQSVGVVVHDEPSKGKRDAAKEGGNREAVDSAAKPVVSQTFC